MIEIDEALLRRALQSVTVSWFNTHDVSADRVEEYDNYIVEEINDSIKNGVIDSLYNGINHILQTEGIDITYFNDGNYLFRVEEFRQIMERFVNMILSVHKPKAVASTSIKIVKRGDPSWTPPRF